MDLSHKKSQQSVAAQKRYIAIGITILLCAIGLSIWILSILGKIAGSWANIVSAIFVASGVGVQALQWLLQSASQEPVFILSTLPQGNNMADPTPSRTGISSLPALTATQALDILTQARKGRTLPTWRVLKAIPLWCFHLLTLIACVDAALFIWSFFGQGIVIIPCAITFVVPIVAVSALEENMIDRNLLVLTPEGFVMDGPSAIAVDYGAAKNIRCYVVRKNWRPIWKEITKLIIEQRESDEKVEVYIGGRFGPSQIIAQEIVLAHRRFLQKAQRQPAANTNQAKKSPLAH